MSNALQRFNTKVSPQPETGCWNWIGWKNLKGYGGFYFDGKNFSAHRFAYISFKGQIPLGYEIDHVCKNTSCVNPNHLRALSPMENKLVSDSITIKNLHKTHCKYGHAFTSDNTLIQVSDANPNRTRRRCRICKRIADKEYKSRHASKGH